MRRFCVTIEYDGSKFVGWQRQKNGYGVQQVLEEALESLCSEKVSMQCAGRTDSGVHAFGQIAHFDVNSNWSSDKIRDGINHFTKQHQVSILKAEEVDTEFNARFDAVQRSYLYRIINRRPPLALDKGRAWWVPQYLNADDMNAASQVLVGNHDFSTFRASECQSRSPIKTLDKLTVIREGDEIKIFTSARSFLYHQVRNMAGSLRLVGEGKWSTNDLEFALKAKDRKKGGVTAPACGLYFVNAKYPGSI